MNNNTIIFGTHPKLNQPVGITTKSLCKHTAIIGQSGSGKTGAILGIVEQYIDQGIPAVLVDIKGDLLNIALTSKERRDNMVLSVITPGSTHGSPINLFKNIQLPERRNAAVSQMLHMVGSKGTSLQSKAHVFLSALLEEYHKAGAVVGVENLVLGLQAPPESLLEFGAMSLEDYFPASSRMALATKLNNLLMAPSFRLWQEGESLDIDKLYRERKDGKAKVTVYSISHLDEGQQMFALAVLFDAIAAWMTKQRGTDDLRASLVVDECAGILPPYPRNPPSKPGIMKMLKQARAFGLGLTLSSQNPTDLDYKAMGNCETWIVGRLIMANDRKRVVEAVATTTTHDKRVLEARVARLSSRNFVLVRPNSTADFYSREVDAQLIGPMVSTEVEEVIRQYKSRDAFE